MTSKRSTRDNRNNSAASSYTTADYAALQNAYRFVPNEADPDEKHKNTAERWQERMARNYEKDLYREVVLADLTRVHLKGSPVGLRWRTKKEVLNGKGKTSCGNKQCPSHYVGSNEYNGIYKDAIDRIKNHKQSSDETEGNDKIEVQQLLERYSFGDALHSYEIPFSYEEAGISKNELVKLRLCALCAPLLFYHKGWVVAARNARHINRKRSNDHDRPACVHKDKKISKKRK